MGFELSEEQRTYRDSLRKFFESEVSPEARKLRVDRDRKAPGDEQLWAKCVEFGLAGVFAAEAEQGVGARELVLTAEEEGRALFPVALSDRLLCSYLLFNVLQPKACAAALEAIGDPTEISAKLGKGKLYGCAALGRSSASAVALKIDRPKKSKAAAPFAKVSGTIPFVPGAEGAAFLIFSAGADVGLVSMEASGVRVKPARSLDLLRASADVTLKAAECTLLPSCRAAVDLGRLVQAAQMSGICERAVRMTADYVRQRKQFDVPIGGFQAVQHQLANAYLEGESLSALVEFAAWAATESMEQLPLAAGSAVSMACSKGPGVVETAIQLHGGIGFTWEYDLHLFLRRAKFIEALYRGGGAEVENLLTAAQRA